MTENINREQTTQRQGNDEHMQWEKQHDITNITVRESGKEATA